MRAAILKVEGLCAGYGRVPVLHGIDLTVADGEILGILGHNGMGKTTLLKTLMGIVAATSGTIEFDGVDVTRLPAHERNRMGLAFVPQGRGIFPNLSVLDNLRMGVAAHEDDEETALRRILQEFPRLERLMDRDGGELSGGEQQLLAIARALASEPQMVLLDEPTEGIQPSIVDEISDVLERLNRRHRISVVLVEQNLEFITGLAGRIALIQKGAITRELTDVRAGDPALVNEFVGFGAARPARATAPPASARPPPHRPHRRRRHTPRRQTSKRAGRALSRAAHRQTMKGPVPCPPDAPPTPSSSRSSRAST
jgi:amidase